MLRALGFQRRMVSWVFLIESSFVALPGIGLVVGLAPIPASQMIADMATDIPGLTYAMALLTTWLLAVQSFAGAAGQGAAPRMINSSDE
jgi:ABC-type antimicrobial peptide transport system permease subunit